MVEGAGNEPQFERMEPRAEAAASACGACQRTIPDQYFEAGGQVFCPACKAAVQASLTGGSRFVRLLKATLFGSVAAAVSAAAWYGIVKLTGYELGIVAVVVGLVVGGAVRAGAERRGGWLYQSLAVLLTYVAIATSYVPMVMDSYREQAVKEAAPEESASEVGESGGEVAPKEVDEVLVLVVGIVGGFVLPVAQVFDGGFIGLLIVSFALYEAWKINKRQRIDFSGPFQLQRGAGTSQT
jgi:hypothetical protein